MIYLSLVDKCIRYLGVEAVGVEVQHSVHALPPGGHVGDVIPCDACRGSFQSVETTLAIARLESVQVMVCLHMEPSAILSTVECTTARQSCAEPLPNT